MNVDFFLKLSQFKIGQLKAPEDYSDRLNHQLIPAILLVCITIVGIRQYIFIPIQCWIPKEWTKSWEEFAENYCWIQNTYFVPVSEGPSLVKEERKLSPQVYYYQWIPFMLALQAAMYYLPFILWRYLSSRSGTDLYYLIRFAVEASTLDKEKRVKSMRNLAQELLNLRRLKSLDVNKRSLLQSMPYLRNRRIPRFSFGKRSGNMLILYYFLVKIISLSNSIGQMFLTQKFLGMDDWHFGITLTSNLHAGRTWEYTGIFPRVTWCDLHRRETVNLLPHTLMCVLPVNMLNERIYIFLWFVFLLSVALGLFSIGFWIYRLFRSDHGFLFIAKLLIIGSGRKGSKGKVKRSESKKSFTPTTDEKTLSFSPPRKTGDIDKEFIDEVLKRDGLFTIWMILYNAGEVATVDLLTTMYEIWQEEKQKEKVNEDDVVHENH